MLLARPLPVGRGLYFYKKAFTVYGKGFLFRAFDWDKSMDIDSIYLRSRKGKRYTYIARRIVSL